MPSRKTLGAVAGLLAALLAVIVVLATASDGSALGRARSGLGDAAESVGDALSVPSPTPTPTTTPVTAADTAARLAAETARALISSAQGHLGLGTTAGNLAAAKEFNSMRPALVDASRGSDRALVDALFSDAADLQARLLVIFPQSSTTPTATPSR